ncbi:MAG: methyltransferase domain-containing protein [Syntrophaceae bacterium]|nr:methyltransferase domain-containing protein [Syntrophaceae bacterium]
MKKLSPTELTQKRYNRIASRFDSMESILEVFFRAWRQKLIGMARGNILEVGIGTGKNFPYYPYGAKVTGIDIADRMLLIARNRVLKLGLSFDLFQKDIQNMGFPDDSFDTVLATFVFCSVPDPVKGLIELRRVLKPDGVILLLEHVRIDKPVIGLLMDLLNPVIVRMVGANINRRTVDNVMKAGFQIESIKDFGPMGMIKMIIANPNKLKKCP